MVFPKLKQALKQSQFKSKLLLPVLAALILIAFTSTKAIAGESEGHDDDSRKPYAIGLWGDLP
jgi:lysophospholipid acyltransferase (LPLAT)-like uncharacterized protein